MRPGVVALALLGALKGVYGILTGTILQPDVSLYAQGGLGVFPSPLGRLVGIGGLPAIQLLNVAANVLLVVGVVLLAERLGGHGIAAGAVALVAPLGIWTTCAGMDTIAAALIVWAAWAYVGGELRGALGFGVSAAMFHAAAFLVVVVVLALRRPMVAAACASAGAVVCLATQYRAALLELDPLEVAAAGLANASLLAVSFLPMVDRLLGAWPVVVASSAAAGLMASGPFDLDARYLLPAVAVCSAFAVSPVRREALA